MARSSTTHQEVDFFSMEKRKYNFPDPPIFKRQRSSHDIQLVTSKINPDILKSVIANVSTSKTDSLTSRPLCDPTLRLSSWCENKDESTPMTIFYNGKVTVFPVSANKACDILKLAQGALPDEKHSLLSHLTEDLPIKRKKSLQKFMKKRAERVTMGSPINLNIAMPNSNLGEANMRRNTRR